MEIELLKPILGMNIGDIVSVSKKRANALMQAGCAKKDKVFMKEKEKATSKKADKREKAIKK